jgi:hypothetical protein
MWLYSSSTIYCSGGKMSEETATLRVPKTLKGFRQMSERKLHGLNVALFFQEPLLTACAKALSSAGFHVAHQNNSFTLNHGDDHGYSLLIADKQLITDTSDERLQQAYWPILVEGVPENFETDVWPGKVICGLWPELGRLLVICLFKESKFGVRVEFPLMA